MIVPMKKVSLLVLDKEREQALRTLRRLGLVHIEVRECTSSRLTQLQEQLTRLENCLHTLTERMDEKKKKKKMAGVKDSLSLESALHLADQTAALVQEAADCRTQIGLFQAELDRLAGWGDVDPAALQALAAHGIPMALHQMSPAEYDKLPGDVTTLVLSRTKKAIRFLVLPTQDGEEAALPESCRVELPKCSTADMQAGIQAARQRIEAIEAQLHAQVKDLPGIQSAIVQVEKELELESHAAGMLLEPLSDDTSKAVTLAWLTGYLPAEDLEQLQTAARKHAWGLLAQDPTPEDDAPTKLKNNKFVSLVYPLTDFIGTVPGYFEYDISAWFLGFILVFFGIIFGDGGYGLIICAIAAVMMAKSRLAKEPIAATWLLVMLLGGATILWGTLTCTWFGLAPEQIPVWLQKLSIPVISNVYGDTLWYPFWTNGEAGLTTAQNVQIFCFSLALVQLSVAHAKGMIRNRRSVKLLGDLGSVLQLLGMFYVVLSLVVNSQVFGLGLVIGGVPVGTVAIALVGVGFVLSFVFSNYEGNLLKSIAESMKNIVSVLLGVVNVFSDIVSYIRLWAVGLAGAAISATVNDLVSPMLGNMMMMVFVIVLLVFGHGLNMILNVLSVIVHGVRLNTLEFSSHLDMSWSGHKYKPFEE